MCSIRFFRRALLIVLCFSFMSKACNESNIADDKLNIIKSVKNPKSQDIEFLEKCLKDDDLVIRRTSARVLIEYFSENNEKLDAIYKNDDAIVSKTALQKIFDNFPEQGLIVAEDALKNKPELVKIVAIANLVNQKPYSAKTLELIKQAQNDKSVRVKKMAVKALWPFHSKKVLLRDRVDFDYEVAVKSTIQVPNEKWLFRTDPNQSGHYMNWFAAGDDESKWSPISIGDFWQKDGYDYSGIAWYRKWIELPEKPSHAAVELHFDSVCESAWVWVNGEYVGEHDEGGAGWDKHFAVDITNEIKWSQKNIIAVRVLSNLPNAGGIWKSVRIEVLDKVSP